MRKKKQTKELQINGERNARSINFVGITLKNIGRNKFKIHEKNIYIYQFQPEATKWCLEGWTCSIDPEEDFYPAVLAQDLKFG